MASRTFTFTSEQLAEVLAQAYAFGVTMMDIYGDSQTLPRADVLCDLAQPSIQINRTALGDFCTTLRPNRQSGPVDVTGTEIESDQLREEFCESYFRNRDENVTVAFATGYPLA